MSGYHNTDSYLRKIGIIGIASFGVTTQRAGSTITRAQDIGTYNKIIVGM
jgi:hypothetical protein